MIINFLGDSITEGWGASDVQHNYVSLVANKLNIKANNYGIGGTRIAKQTVLYPNENGVDLYYGGRVKDMDKSADIVIVFGGTNDYGHGDAIMGENNDSDPHTFKGAINYLIDELLKYYKQDKIAFISPLYRINEESRRGDNFVKEKETYNLEEYRKALKEVLKDRNILYWDIKDEIGHPEENGLFVDGLHPNNKGYQKIADVLSRYIKEYFMKDL